MSHFTRRRFLFSSAGLTLPLMLPGLGGIAPATADTATGDTLVCIFLRGAMDGLHAVVPYGDPNYYAKRPTLAVPPPGSASGCLDLDGFFGLHPALAALMPWYQAGHLALVQATGSPDDSHSHFDAQDYMELGTPGISITPDGWIGRHLETKSGNDSAFRAVAIGSLVPLSLLGQIPALAVADVNNFGLWNTAPGFANSLRALYLGTDPLEEAGQDTLDALDELKAANPGQYQAENGAQYPNGGVGAALQQTAQLIKSSLRPEAITLDFGGWDTHQGEAAILQNLFTELASGLSAFGTDLGSRMESIALVVMTEFGRRVAQNGTGGTDHGHGSCMWLLGGGVNGGHVYGSWPGLADNQLYGPGDLQITTDYRTILAEVVQKRLLNSALAQVFPGFTPPSYLGVCV